LRKAVRLMDGSASRGVPIVDDAGRLVGIITNRGSSVQRELDPPDPRR